MLASAPSHPLALARLALPWRIARIALPVAMLAVLLGGLLSTARLGAAVGQPLAGFVMTWRKEMQLYTVSYATPPTWPALAPGLLRVNDLILNIDGLCPHSDNGLYGKPAASGGVGCPNGHTPYAQLYRLRWAEGARQLTFTVERAGKRMVVSGVPLAPFTWSQLAEIYLPFLLLGLGFLAVGAVVWRAAPYTRLNLIFAAFATILAGVMIDDASPWRLSDRFEDPRILSLALVIAWLPLLGATIVHLAVLLREQAGVTTRLRYLVTPFYALSAAFALLGIFAYGWGNHPLSPVLTPVWGNYVTISALGGGLIAAVALVWTALRAPARQARRQAGMILGGLLVLGAFAIPYLFFFFRKAPVTAYMQVLPYLGLAAVAVFAYAILRYQLFSAKSGVLTVLLVAIFCILVDSVVYILFGGAMPFLPLLVATLSAGLALEARRGPSAFFHRLLRREAVDYATVVQFSQQVGGLQQIDSLVQAASDCLVAHLETDQVITWLFEEERQSCSRYVNGSLAQQGPLPSDLPAALVANPGPVRRAQAAPAFALLPAGQDVALWAPLIHGDAAIGMLGLGPRWTGEVYDERDLQLARVLARRLALSIANTRQLERLQATSRLLLQVEDNERRKIAHELHDTVLQFLLVLTYGLDDLRERTPEIAAEVERWQDRIGSQARELRDLLAYLRAPELLVEQGLVDALRGWLEQVRQETLALVEMDLDGSVEESLAVEAKVALYRVCREAVRNALKHSGGDRVCVRLMREADDVRISIEDNGRGFDLARALEPSGKGYSSLRDQRMSIESVGGRLEIRSSQGGGATIDAWAPVTVG